MFFVRGLVASTCFDFLVVAVDEHLYEVLHDGASEINTTENCARGTDHQQIIGSVIASRSREGRFHMRVCHLSTIVVVLRGT